MHYIGVDYHKKYSSVVVKDREGKVERRGKVNNTKEEFWQLLKPYQTGKAVLEATRNWGLVYDWLEEILDDVALAHPLKVRAIAEARIKTDKISADILCDLLRSNLLPEAYVPNKKTREAKNILRQRMFFVRVQTMVKNRIYTILDRHPEILSQSPDVSDLFGASGTVAVIGFLGAGAIIRREGGVIAGLTTAATIWAGLPVRRGFCDKEELWLKRAKAGKKNWQIAKICQR